MSCALGGLSWTDTPDQEKEGSRAARGTAPGLPQPPGPGQGPPSPVCSKLPSNRGQPEVKLMPAPRCGCKVRSKSSGPHLQGKKPPPGLEGRQGRPRSASPARGLGLLITNPVPAAWGDACWEHGPAAQRAAGQPPGPAEGLQRTGQGPPGSPNLSPHPVLTASKTTF